MNKQSYGINSVIELISESNVTKMMALGAGFLALFSFEFGDAPFAVKVVGIVGILLLTVNVLLAGLKRISLENFTAGGSALDPFGLNENWAPWERRNYVKEILERLNVQANRHVLLIGPTGAGKSILLGELLPKQLPEYTIVGPISEFRNIPQKILLNIANEFPESALNDRMFELSETINSRNGQKIGELAVELPFLVREAIGDVDVIFLFDHVERYLVFSQKLSKSDLDRFEQNTLLIRSILKGLREIDSVRTLFAIRSEFFFGSIGNLFHTRKDGKGLEDVVEFHFMWGINKEDDSSIYSDMASVLDKALGTGGKIPNKVASIANFESRLNADSFALRLGAFLYLELYQRKRFRDALDQSSTVDDLVDILLDASFEGACKQLNRPTSDRTLFDSILFSLASENQATGNGCSLIRISGLAHFPKSDVVIVVQHLTLVGLLSVQVEDGDEHYRIAHDKISDRILKSEKLDVHSRGLNAIRSLTENDVRTSSLTMPKIFPSPLETSKSGLVNISYLAVVVFVIFGF